ncbi:MAG: FGGY family carbohydrate kinase [Promethearchaeota archaeon]
MTSSETSGYTIGIDLGSSGIRVLLLNTMGSKLNERIITYTTLKEQGCRIWDEEMRIDVTNLEETIENQLILLLRDVLKIRILTLSISSIGPSLVLLSKDAQPLTKAFTYAYQGAQDYVKYLPRDFQKRTGSLFSGTLPYVQLLKIKEESLLKSCFKITTINDYITWKMTDLPLEKIFSTVPNASYTGLYSLINSDWDMNLLRIIGLNPSTLPKIIPLGTTFPIKNLLKEVSPTLRDTRVITGAIDGIDAFWATGVESEDIIVGSASSTGALRRLRKTPKKEYNSRLIQCCQIDEGTWVELIPFNNVGTSFTWLANNFNKTFKNYLTEENQLNIEKLESEAKNKLKDEGSKSYILKLPLYFPYIEGEPRGPNGRGKIKGGFIFQKTYFSCVDLYLSLLIGIVNMYKHNLEVLDPPDDYREIRLTGLIAQKSRLFLQFLALSVNKKIVVMETEQSIAWATGMRALTYINEIERIPKVSLQDLILPEDSDIQTCLSFLYGRYMKVYNAPNSYQIIHSEEEINR